MISSMLNQRRCLKIVGAIGVVLLVVIFSDSVLGQAGGGGAYGGGGGGGGGYSGGGGGGSGGGGDALAVLIMLTFEYPLLAIPVWIVLGFLFFYGKKFEGEARVGRTIRKGRKIQTAELQAVEHSKLIKGDADFKDTVFLDRVSKAFITTQYAWSEQQLESCRPFISDGIHERFQLYIAMQKKENIRNRMRDVQIRAREIVAIESERDFDTIHVRFVASAVSYNEGLDSGKRVSGNSDQSPITFTEIWSFSRRSGVQTQSDKSIMEGACPNCGAPIDIVDRAQCPHCDSIVNSGQYDWVLTEITQSEEWVVPQKQEAIPGWQQLTQQDPALNLQHLEDRASVMFWRCLMAQYFEDTSYATPILSHQRNDLPRNWRLNPGQFWKNPAVGVVEVKSIEPATEGDSFDRCRVIVRWSGTRAEGNRRQPRILGKQTIFTHEMVLMREKGVVSQSDQTFSSFSCTNCGSPIQVGSKSTCEFCGSILNDGSKSWVLEAVAIGRFGNVETRSGSSSSSKQKGLETESLTNLPELLGGMARIMAVDGELHPKEKEHLTNLAVRRGFSKSRLSQIFSAALASDEPIKLPEKPPEVRAFMDHLIRVALIDGKLTGSEKKVLVQIGERVGWVAADLNVAITRNRSALYREAQAIIRKQKKNSKSQKNTSA